MFIRNLVSSIHFMSFLVLLILFQKSSWAVQAPYELNEDGKKPTCNWVEDFCKQFGPVAEGNIHTPRSLVTDQPWSDVDDMACCDIAQGDKLFSTSSSCPHAVASPAPNFPADSCQGPDGKPIIISQSILDLIAKAPETSSHGSYDISRTTDPNKTCLMAGNIKYRCQYHNSQVVPQCLAFNLVSSDKSTGASDAYSIDIALATLDFLAATSCAIACATVHPYWIRACIGLGLSEGILETGTVMKMQAELAGVLDSYQSIVSASDGKTVSANSLAGGEAVLGTSIGSKVGALASLSSGAARTFGKGTANSKDFQRKMACLAAPVYATLGGVRTAAAAYIPKIRGDACANVLSLLDLKRTSSSDSESVPNPFRTPTSSSDDASSQRVSTGGEVSGNTGIRNVSGKLDAFESCVRGSASMGPGVRCQTSDPSQCTSQCAAPAGLAAAADSKALDANLLNTPNIKNSLKDNLSLSDLAKKIQNEGAGAALGSLLPPSAGAVGAALTDIAKTAQENGAKLANSLSIPTFSAYSGGGSITGVADANEGALFGPTSSTSSSVGSKNIASLSYEKAISKGIDIFHSGSNSTIFEIISDKIEKVSNRVTGAKGIF